MALTMWKGKAIRAALTLTGEGWDKLHPEVKQRAERVLRIANAEFAKDGLIVGIHEGWRDVSRQAEVMQGGYSAVTHPLKSYHPWGLAVDFVFLTGPGLWTWDPDNLGKGADQRLSPSWQKLGAIIKAEGFEWGGDWVTIFDGPHAQLPIMRTAELNNTYHTPEAFITWG